MIKTPLKLFAKIKGKWSLSGRLEMLEGKCKIFLVKCLILIWQYMKYISFMTIELLYVKLFSIMWRNLFAMLQDMYSSQKVHTSKEGVWMSEFLYLVTWMYEPIWNLLLNDFISYILYLICSSRFKYICVK
jgi:hypothetical protein